MEIIQPGRVAFRLSSAAARGLVGVQPAGGEVVAQLLVGGLYELWVFEDLLDLVWGGVAADVFFLQYVPQVRPFANAVDGVLEDLALPLGAGLISEEDPVPKRLLFSVMLSPQPLAVMLCPCPPPV